ncbi:CACTA en-spm transposon protein [Cucumis melo var. makuwa]|uniref:CACTA en-spm transposon protein n=1 Tax=Cucumis melo var. makuwa TaxID=1194695 RepID=A0A5D3CK72_CUCMM|nr:CACTA en-spm transposon protein [Cucumis melo var. makuwa]TYK12327.1 CACTA en-spm transposon protein [Cucumis melo var. makuwa]
MLGIRVFPMPDKRAVKAASEKTLFSTPRIMLRERQLKTKGKGRREKQRFVAVRSSLSFILSSLSSLAVPLQSATLDSMFLEFEDDLDNIAGGSSSVGDNAESSSQQPATLTSRRCAQSRLLELERHVAINGCILMTITLRAEKPISPHAIRFSQRFFVLDFNDQAMNRFVQHQMHTTFFKEFQTDYHRHFKKYSDPEEARANPPNALVGRHEN